MNKAYEITTGNTFFITELIRDFLAKGIIHLKYPEWIFKAKEEDFPKDLKDLLDRKFESLEKEEKEFLLAAAGIGKSFKFDLCVTKRFCFSYSAAIVLSCIIAFAKTSTCSLIYPSFKLENEGVCFGIICTRKIFTISATVNSSSINNCLILTCMSL